MYAEKFYDQVDSASAKYQLLTLPLQILKGCLTFIFDDSVKKKKEDVYDLKLAWYSASLSIFICEHSMSAQFVDEGNH